jgi:hypothetical protein
LLITYLAVAENGVPAQILSGYLFLTLVAMGCRALARSQPTPTPTKTPRPTFTPTRAVTQTAVVMATAIPLPTDMPVPLVPLSYTPTPTESPPHTSIPTPTPRPDVDFTIVKQDMRRVRLDRCDGLPEIELRVLDKNGEPLDHVRLEVYWDGGHFFKSSGWLGPGYDNATVTSGTFWVKVTTGVPPYDINEYTSEVSRPLSTDHPTREDLEKAGYCQPDGKYADCILYSYEVVFQRQWQAGFEASRHSPPFLEDQPARRVSFSHPLRNLPQDAMIVCTPTIHFHSDITE